MKKLVFLTGAGMSAESGFSTFRDKGGLWEKYPVEQVATPDGWLADPNLVTDFYNGLRRQLVLAKPNRGHELVAQLEKDFDVTVITQNVDDLHERAGSSRVIHLHGELMKVSSSREPDNPRYIRRLPPGRTQVGHGERAADGSLLRPWIVWFGEAVPKIGKAIDIVSRADILLIVGSSLSVYPAAGLYRYAPSSAPVFLIDPADVNVRDKRIRHIRAVASEGMEEFTRLVREM